MIQQHSLNFVDVTVSLVVLIPKSLEKTVLYHGVTL